MESSSLRFSQETQLCFMNKLSPKLKPTISIASSIHIRSFSASSSSQSQTTHNLKNHQPQPQIIVPERRRRVLKASSSSTTSDAQLKENWLTSLSYAPLPQTKTHLFDEEHTNDASKWVLGIDPDVSGAVALLKTHDSEACIAQVFDSPFVQILVGKRTRKRLDAKSIVQLVRSFDAPVGTTAFIEQSNPYPQDGKQGWWSGGFGYGLWIGILVASGFSVVPVPSVTWKAKFELSGSGTSKDDSRRVASTLFPSLSSLLSRKKDHGRAEALLIAAYGKNQNNHLESSCSTIIEKLDNGKLA